MNGTVLQSFVRPAVLITDAFNALNTQPSKRQKDQEFIGAVLHLNNHQLTITFICTIHVFSWNGDFIGNLLYIFQIQ